MKRRLVGAVVLVSLAVIFLPMLLEEPKDYEVRIDHTNIPPPPPAAPPPFKAGVLPVPEGEPLIPPLPASPERSIAQAEPLPEAVAQVPARPPEPTPEARFVAPPAPAKVASAAPEPRGGVSAWVVQLASLASREKAEQLEQRLRDLGFSAFLEPIRSGGRELTRIRVGPEADHARAERIAADIEKKVRIRGQVVRYP
jgi:DedD protein